ncbi:MAG: hypothetical protein IJD71_04570 [Clostridia bacterium]|nr:hypothetical protein [Clostridia bacterium]MBQ9919587.1 hypothetical protein [Clostridia bacterium]
MSQLRSQNPADYPSFFKRRRAGILLTRDEIAEIKKGRKDLRRQMRLQGVYSRRDFEATASSLGLYFDKGRFLAFWLWLWHRGALGMLFAAAALVLAALYGYSMVTEMRGHFTINLADSLVDQGFELCNTVDFANPTSRIYSEPVEDAPCISITDLPNDLNDIDGSHNGSNYFAHTFYIAKRGEGAADCALSLSINSESLDASKAIWVMLFEDGKPVVYAEKNATTGGKECLPAEDNNRYGYREIPYSDKGLPADQYSVIAERSGRTYYRLKPYPFKQDDVICEKVLKNVKQDEVHKYTVVMWLEGDDPDCTNDLIGAHIGLQMDFELLDTENQMS